MGTRQCLSERHDPSRAVPTSSVEVSRVALGGHGVREPPICVGSCASAFAHPTALGLSVSDPSASSKNRLVADCQALSVCRRRRSGELPECRARFRDQGDIMRKSLALLAILAPAVLGADVASAAKSLAQCGSEYEACQLYCAGKSDLSFRKSCFIRCESGRKICANKATSGGKPGKIEVGGKLVVTPPKYSGSGINNPQAVPLTPTNPKYGGSSINNLQAVPLTPTNPKYVRPVSGGNPCTVHCGPVRPSSKGR
jgi:hypothetical protein